MIELVKQPWVRAVALPHLDTGALEAFAEEHGLGDLAGPDQETPIARILNAAYKSTLSHADLLSEFAGRFCYRAWGKGRETPDYLANVVAERHGNVLAHSTVSFVVTGVSRALTHELIRHHVGTNPSQESQRYVTAEGGEIEVIGYRAMRAVVPPLVLKAIEDAGGYEGAGYHFENIFRRDFEAALHTYNDWLERLKAQMEINGFPGDATIRKKRANEAARAFLPNACETRLVWTMNLRAARHVIERRGDTHADLEIRRLAVAFAREVLRIAPLSFQDVDIYTADDGFEAVRVAHYGV